MSPDASQPSGQSRPRDDAWRPSGLAVPARLGPGVLAKVGETFAASASRLLSSLSTLGPLPRGLQARLGAVSAEVGRLEALGVRIQEIARVLGGQAPLPPERMDFAGAVRAVLGQWAPPSRVAGVRVVAPDDPVQVELNAAVLAQLLGLAVECALQVGPVVEVRVEGSGQPTLTVRTDRPSDAGTNDEGEELGDLHWTLFALLARAVGLLLQRLVAGRTVSMTLRFPEAEAGAQQQVDRDIVADVWVYDPPALLEPWYTKQVYTALSNPEEHRIRHWACEGTQNNDVIQTKEGGSTFRDLTFTNKDDSKGSK